jgi:hypothetical protein
MSRSQTPPIRGADCPPRVSLEAFSAGEEPQLGLHVEGCPHCGPFVAALRVDAAAFVRARPADLFLRQLDRRPSRPSPRWWFALVAVAASAGVALWVRPTTPEEPRFKGDAFHVFLKRGEAEPVPVKMDQAVRPGDQLRFSYQASIGGWLAVFELDGTEQVEVRSATEVSPGARMLPGAIALDASAGPEWFVSVFSATPLDVEALRAQLRGQARHARVTLQCGQCQVEAVRVVKGLP